MIPTQRQQSLLSELHEKGAVRVSELSIQLGVSPMTVRRDIEDLAGKGLLKRVHGGAVSASTLLAEPLFSVKSRMETAVKQEIAAKAVEYVAPGDVIAVGGGSTTYAFAQCLLESKCCEGVTILTNSIPVAQLAHSAEASGSVEVIMTGGAVTRSNSLEAATNSALISIADLCIALVDHTKWDSTSLSLFADFSQIDTVITDSALSGPRRKQTRSLVKHLVTV